MHANRTEIEPALDIPDITIRIADWGGMTVESGTARNRTEPGGYFKGLPDDRCQCPHWGFVIKGQLRYSTADGDEVFNAGDIYYVAPGHVPHFEAGTEYVEFSPTEELNKTAEVVLRNIETMGLPQVAV